MFIPYEKIGLTLRYLMPKYGKRMAKICEELRIKRNVSYTRRNAKIVTRKLRKKAKKQPIKVAFLCSEPSKWKCQSLFDLLQKNKHFEPFILATKCDTTVQTPKFAYDTYEFFKTKNMSVKYAYDLDRSIFTHSKDFDADIIFYQQPWNNETTQGPVVASKYALTCYVPYFVATSESWIEYGLRFHEYVQNHYVLNKAVFNEFSQKMKNKGDNLKIAGHPQLDHFYLNQDKKSDKKYVIFAPHHSIEDPRLDWSTFKWSGDFMLEYAQNHPEINWIFKPHPFLKTTLKLTKTMNDKEIEKYWNDWKKVSLVYESGDYIDLFEQSYAMITDCGSFLTEYFFTKRPLIHLRRTDSMPFNESVNKIIENYYSAYSQPELSEIVDDILIKKNDRLKTKRENSLNELGFENVYAAENIMNDLQKMLEIF